MKKLFTLTAVLLVFVQIIRAEVYYVSLEGNNANSGLSWSQSLKDIQAAMEKATKGDEIWVKAGEYTLTAHYVPGQTSGGEAGVWLSEGVSIYGSFEGTEINKDDRARVNPVDEPWKFANPTIILGGVKKDGTTPLRLFDRADKSGIFSTRAYVDGLYFKNYDAQKSRLIYMKENHVVRNCLFSNCKDNASVLYFEDGGRVENTLFEGCKKALYVRPLGGPAPSKEERQTIEIINCVFSNNVSSPIEVYSTSATEVESPAITISGCKFYENTIELSSPYVASAYHSGGILLLHSSKNRFIDISDCIFENNVNKDNGASSVMINGGGKVNFYNNIIRNNRTEKADEVTGKTAVFIVYQNPEGGNIFNNLIVNNGSNNGLIYSVASVFFNNTVANNTGSMYFPTAPVIFNNLFSQNQVDGVDAQVHLDAGVFATYMYNVNTSNVTLASGENDFVSDNVLLSSGEIFVAPTSFVGNGDINSVREASYALTSSSRARNTGSITLLGDEGLSYPQSWFDKYFTIDLAGNSRLDGELIDAGAYQFKVNSAVKNIIQTKNKCYLNDGRIVIDSKNENVVRVFNLHGQVVLQTLVVPGINQIAFNKKGMFVIEIKSGQKSETFKIISL